MSIAEKITQIAGNEPKVYKAGKIALLKSSTHMQGTATSTQADNMLFLRDVSPVEHTMTVKLTGGEYKITENLAVNFVSEGTKADGTPNDFSPYGIPVGWNLVDGQNYGIKISGSMGSGVQDTTYFLPAVLCSTGYYALGYVPGHHEVDYGYLPFGIYTRDGDTTMYWTGKPQYENDYVSFSLSISTNVDTSYSTVTRYGKNLFNISSSRGFESQYVGLTNTISGNVLTVVCSVAGRTGYLELGTIPAGTYTFSYEEPQPMSKTIMVGSDISSLTVLGDPFKNNTKTFTLSSENKVWVRNAGFTNGTYTFSNIQLEYGSSATEYSPYAEPTTYTQSLPDVVNVPSLYPTTVLSVDTIGATMECSYLRDIDTYIDNLTMNVALTGGE